MNQGDVFTFLAADNRYKVIICTSIYKARSPHYCIFAALTYDNEEIPVIEDAINSGFWGKAVYKGGNFKYPDSQIQCMWQYHPEIKPYYLGSYGLLIWRKDFLQFKDNMKFVGNLKIINDLDKNVNSSMNASSWLTLQRFFNSEISKVLTYRSQKVFEVRSVLCQ
ncbi:hypothetical protein [Mucilaginibacter sp. NFR10]|uniref:hypothetical protein n=1 Tax=Mucilaginibacter sp. NFR10 TaxID=1566292 RepID=UPI000871537B|nr:hypothetical protein [Mucilaginibacter sp. NFR10]SCW80341.1 hypothetical protein SAMN03159284_04367 [Mucilaginibacter sp. NFR10]